MELRHLRYFIAVAEEGSLTVAAERRLHTAQPSLSRQIRDLEDEVGVALLVRSSRGVELTPAGRAFLDHARLALTQVDAAGEAARRAARPANASFAMGFLNGQEMKWLPGAIGILRQELPNMDVILSSKTSPELSNALVRGQMDVAFLRPDRQVADLEYRLLTKEPMVVVLPSDHRLAAAKEIDPRDLAGDTFITVSKTAPMLRIVIDDYLQRLGLDFVTKVEVDNLSGAISLIASTRGVAILPIYAVNFLPWSVVSRPIVGEAPTIDLALGYHRANNSPILRLFLSKADELIELVSRQRSQGEGGRG